MTIQILAAPDGAVGPEDRATWLTPPFDVAWVDTAPATTLRLVAAPDAAVGPIDRALWLTPPFTRPWDDVAPGSTLRIVAAPDGLPGLPDRALWLTPPFTIGWDDPGLRYRVYANDGAGGPVDYATPLASVAAPSYDVGPLAFGSDWTFAVRARDGTSGPEERNVDARVRILVGTAGADLAGLPGPPFGLRAVPLPGAGAAVSWGYNPGGAGAPPSGFRVYDGTPTVSYAAPAATVAYNRALAFFSATLAALAPGTHQFAVRAYNAAGEESNPATFTLAVSGAGPGPAENLTATILS